MDQNVKKRIQGLVSLIGNTPLLSVHFTYKGSKRVIYAKLESLNMTGSIKDRMAFHILRKAVERNELKPGQRIIEVSSGNSGISFSAIGKALGYPVTIYMPDWLSCERINLIKSLGAEIVLVSKEEGGFLKGIEMAEEQAHNENGFLPRQFSNADNIEAHYLTTAPELMWQLRFRNLQPYAFVAGVGTGGTVMGVGRYLKEIDPSIMIHPVEPSNSPTLSTGYKIGKHRIQGISDDFIPPIVDLNSLDKVVSIDDGDSIIMSQKLANLGIGVGISSGANFLAALKVQEEIGHDKVIVTVFADSNKKYFSTDYSGREPVKKEFLSKDIELEYFISYKRVCQSCCIPESCDEAEYYRHKGAIFPHCPHLG
ncbi:MAG TPA: cysteine synthase family protein [Bacteroidales bacterium]|nr:cysteine synthase family protein [Bacteroidales bacterium]